MGLTLGDVNSERTSGYLLASECYIYSVRALQNRAVGAAENTVPLVFQNDLHRVSTTLRVHNDHTNITCSRT